MARMTPTSRWPARCTGRRWWVRRPRWSTRHASTRQWARRSAPWCRPPTAPPTDSRVARTSEYPGHPDAREFAMRTPACLCSPIRDPEGLCRLRRASELRRRRRRRDAPDLAGVGRDVEVAVRTEREAAVPNGGQRGVDRARRGAGLIEREDLEPRAAHDPHGQTSVPATPLLTDEELRRPHPLRRAFVAPARPHRRRESRHVRHRHRRRIAGIAAVAVA